ncbi:MAG: hypothetical protein B6U97_03500 [Candidatus Altiarchaeales archaeon ex4484_96]|nr:MAG: hypothetical protein B6U97_03500 [Candidatus Altiarchaeales archaeon ex4484_96]
MRFGVKYKVEAYDRDGKKVASCSKTILRGEGSFVANFAKALYAHFAKTSVEITKTDGTTATYYEGYGAYSGYSDGVHPMFNLAGDNDDTYGIVVGSGSTAVSPNDYALESQIPHGTSAGQLDYEACEAEPVSISGNRSEFKLRRQFIEKSGNAITVREIGIYVRQFIRWNNSTKAKYPMMVARDVLSSPITVPAYGSLLVEYTIYVEA